MYQSLINANIDNDAAYDRSIIQRNITERDLEAKFNRMLARRINCVCDRVRDFGVWLITASTTTFLTIKTVYKHTNLINFMHRHMNVLTDTTSSVIGISAVILSAQFIIRGCTKMLKVRPAEITTDYELVE